MARLNLKGMSVEDLVLLRDRVQAELSRKIGQERGALQKQIDALTELEVAGGAAATSPATRRGRRGDGRRSTTDAKGTVEPKYRGPDGSTWTGRGRSPRWLAELEAAGKKRDTYLIKT